MKCEDVELELSSGELSSEVQSHLTACESCRASAQVLDLAALPALTKGEQLALGGLATSTFSAWRRRQATSSRLRRMGSLALAAGLGALISSVALQGHQPEPLVRTVVVQADESYDFEEANLSDDEVFFEIGWPSPTEGDM